MKQSSGFTLFEVLIALTMIGFTLMAVFGLQLSLSRSTQKGSRLFQRMWQMKKFLRETTIDPPPIGHQRTQLPADPPVQLQYEQYKPKKGSALAQEQDIIIEKVEGKWLGEKESVESLVTIRYRREERDES